MTAWLNIKAELVHWLTPIKGVLIATTTAALASTVGAVEYVALPVGFWLWMLAAILFIFLGLVAVVRTVLYFELAKHGRDERSMVESVRATGDSFTVAWETERRWRKELEDEVKAGTVKVGEHEALIAGLRSDVDALKQNPVIKKFGG